MIITRCYKSCSAAPMSLCELLRVIFRALLAELRSDILGSTPAQFSSSASQRRASMRRCCETWSFESCRAAARQHCKMQGLPHMLHSDLLIFFQSQGNMMYTHNTLKCRMVWACCFRSTCAQSLDDSQFREKSSHRVVLNDTLFSDLLSYFRKVLELKLRKYRRHKK